MRSMVEGARRTCPPQPLSPSTALRAVPLPTMWGGFLSALALLAAPAMAETVAITGGTVAIGDGSQPIPGGTVVIPNEPFAPYGPDSLLPVRSLALWSYTDLTDPRWTLEKEAIRLSVDEHIHSQQKIGVLNKQGWVSYEMDDLVFTKHASLISDAVYPDMNSNFEVYTDGGFVEIESLSPLRHLEPGQFVEHQERWEIALR